MSNPSLFVSPLVRQAARNLYQLELIRGTLVWTDCYCRRKFWHVQRMMARTPDETAAWLPALAFAVSHERNTSILDEFARWTLPEPLPPEAIPWRDRLIQVWEQYPADTTWEKTIRLAALVRLDRRAERLPEWLREARRALNFEWYNRHFCLAVLAGWRPRPGDRPPHASSTEIAHGTDSTGAAPAWIRFWEKLYRSPNLKSLMATAALLNLAEAGWLPSGPCPERLRAEFHQRVQQWTVSYHEGSVLQMALASVPADASAPERLRQDIKAWLELTRGDVNWQKREAVWDMFAAWQREGVLERCGGSLAPDLARALEWERNHYVLWAMAGYVPDLAEVRAHPEAARAIIARWGALSQSDNWLIRQAAWVGRWNLMRAGVLTAGEQARFDADYVEAIGAENDRNVLLALAQITPLGTFPLVTWAGRLSDQNDWRRLAAQLAIHGWLVEVMEGASGGQRRQMRQVLRRTGQEGTDAGAVAPFVNLPPEVWPDFWRLREIETALAAGHLPPSPDAGAGNRPSPRTVPARLPEAHPRTGPPGITGRTAGSEPPARHPFPEAGRHE